MNQWFTKLVDDEFNRLERKTILDDAQNEKTLRLTPACGKLRHRSLSWLQEDPNDPEREALLRELFKLDPES